MGAGRPGRRLPMRRRLGVQLLGAQGEPEEGRLLSPGRRRLLLRRDVRAGKRPLPDQRHRGPGRGGWHLRLRRRAQPVCGLLGRLRPVLHGRCAHRHQDQDVCPRPHRAPQRLRQRHHRARPPRRRLPRRDRRRRDRRERRVRGGAAVRGTRRGSVAQGQDHGAGGRVGRLPRRARDQPPHRRLARPRHDPTLVRERRRRRPNG